MLALRSTLGASARLGAVLSSRPTCQALRILLRLVSDHTFIRTEATPNPQCLKFLPGRSLVEGGTHNFPNAASASGSPLAKRLFGIHGVKQVLLGSDFVAVTKTDDVMWNHIKPEIFAAMSDSFEVEEEALVPDTPPAEDTAIRPEDGEVVATIKELLETRIRPSVQEDGGDVRFVSFENGIVFLRLVGACSSCPMATATLKQGIENMLMHYCPEVEEVRAVQDDEMPYM